MAPRFHFPKIRRVSHEGPRASLALAFRRYNPDEIIDGGPMAQHMVNSYLHG
jgi:xylose isomerase